MSLHSEFHSDQSHSSLPHWAGIGGLIKRLSQRRRSNNKHAGLGGLPDRELRDVGYRRDMHVSPGKRQRVGRGRDAIADSVLWQARS